MGSTWTMSTDAIDDAYLVATDVTACSFIPVSPVLDGALGVSNCSIGGALLLSFLLLLLVVEAVVVGLVAYHNVLVDAWSIFL